MAQQSDEIHKTFQPAEIYAMLGVRNTEEAEKVLTMAYNLINYLSVGDSIQTSVVCFTKLSPDLVYLESKINKQDVTDTLIKKKIIRVS